MSLSGVPSNDERLNKAVTDGRRSARRFYVFLPDYVLSGKASLRFPDSADKFRGVRTRVRKWTNSGRLATNVRDFWRDTVVYLLFFVEYMFIHHDGKLDIEKNTEYK